MEMDMAVKALAALGQETRLAAFRALVQAGPQGVPAGTLAERLGVPGPTLSVHLARLEQAGLVASRRAGRQIFYAADYGGMRSLLAYLVEDCCAGSAEICSPMAGRLVSVLSHAEGCTS